MKKITKRDQHYYGGLLTALIVINLFDQPRIIEEIMGTLSNDSQKDFIQFIKENGEYELSGIGKWEEDSKEKLT